MNGQKLCVGEQRDSNQSGASALESVDGCLGSSFCGRGGGSSGGRREEGGGPKGYTRSHFQVPLEGQEVGLQRGETRSSSIRPVPPSPLLWLPAPWLCESWGFGWQYAALRARKLGEWGADPGVRGKMPILLFLIDTSASMNQRTDLGTSYLDIAKGAVELFLKVKTGERRDGENSQGMGVDLGVSVTFVSPPPPFFPSRPPPSSLVPQLRARDPASRGDRYMLVTYDEHPYCIKVKGPSRRWGGREVGASLLGWLPLFAPVREVLCRLVGHEGRGGARGAGRAVRSAASESLRRPGSGVGQPREETARKPGWWRRRPQQLKKMADILLLYKPERETEGAAEMERKEGGEGRGRGLRPAPLGHTPRGCDWRRGRASRQLRPRCSGPDAGFAGAPASPLALLPPPPAPCCFSFPPLPLAPLPFLLRAWQHQPLAFKD